MLEKLLQLISETGTLQVAVLARQLEVSPTLVEQMIQHLERMGYLQAVETCLSDQCSGCALKQGCSSGKFRLWKTKEA